VKIQHTRENQAWWFYATAVFVPIGFMSLGAVRVRIAAQGGRPMIRGVIVYGALLAVTLGASYYRWTHEPDKDLEGKVVVLQGEPDTLDRITWKGKDDEAVIEKKKDDKGRLLLGDVHQVGEEEARAPRREGREAETRAAAAEAAPMWLRRKRQRKRRRGDARPRGEGAVVSNFKSGKAGDGARRGPVSPFRGAQARGRHARQAQDDRARRPRSST
jgi:hypothetical protein